MQREKRSLPALEEVKGKRGATMQKRSGCSDEEKLSRVCFFHFFFSFVVERTVSIEAMSLCSRR